jgi:hypothetical protein
MQKKLGIAVVSHPLLRLARLAHGHRHRMGFVALELAMLVAPAATRPAVARYAAPAIIGVTTSAAMNAFVFASHADGLLIFPTIGLGFAVPALVYALTKTGAIMFSARGLQ